MIPLVCLYKKENLQILQQTNWILTASKLMEKSSSSSPKWVYDVFLSSGDEDAASHLNKALQDEGMIISPRKLEALRASRISVVIFSENFASSAWCLEELAGIFKCMNQGRQEVVPIFYHVVASDIQGPDGEYRNAFNSHRKNFGLEKAREWEDAMKKIASNPGLELQKISESKFVEKVVRYIRNKLVKLNSVGLDKHIEKMRSFLDIDKLDVRFIGVWGMGGTGKTTIAQLVYEEMSDKFEGSSFLANVKEASENKSCLVRLQEQLLSDILMAKSKTLEDRYEGMDKIKLTLSSRRVLVVLDDVDKKIQLESLTGGPVFAPGSRVIITTRDRHMLDILHGGEKIIYEVRGLTRHEALKLFCRKAFGDDEPADGYKKLSMAYVKEVGGLPLALHVLGSYLSGHDKAVWASALNRLKMVHHEQVMDGLKISIEGLQEHDRNIFLDIACFFNGENKDSLIEVLNSTYDCHAQTVIRILANKGLITISNKTVWMHELLQYMGREIVWQEHTEPGMRSRLWLINDLYHVLKSKMVLVNIQGIALESGGPEERQLNGSGFSNLKNLRVLKVRNLNLSRSFDYLSNELRYLEWHGYPFRHLPSSFAPGQLVKLQLPSSKIEALWKGVEVPMIKLKEINLSYCRNLKEIGNFKIVPKLEKLILTGCRKLKDIHHSINVLCSLVELNLQNCESLELFPNDISGLTSLQILNFYGCPRLGKLPNLGAMTSLQELQAAEIAIADPKSVSGFSSLVKLHLSDCNLKEVPSEMSSFPELESLNLSGNRFSSMPSLKECSHLEELSLGNCKHLRTLTDLPSSIKSLNLRNCISLNKLEGLSELSELEDLILSGCKDLESLPKLPSSIKDLTVDDCTSLKHFPDPVEIRTSRPLRLSFANCSTLNDEIEITWLNIYLESLKQHKDRKKGELSMFLPRKTILGFCESRSAGGSFKAPLHRNYWCNEDLLGFAICAIFDFGKPPAFGIKGDLFAQKDKYMQALGEYYAEISLGDRVTDHLWFLFIPHDKSRANLYDRSSLVKLASSFSHLDLEVKGWGFQIVYKNEVGELIKSALNSKNLDLPGSSKSGRSTKSGKSQRSKDGKRSEEEVHPSENDDFLEFLLNDSGDDDETNLAFYDEDKEEDDEDDDDDDDDDDEDDDHADEEYPSHRFS